MSGTEATATLSLEIKTTEALTPLQTLNLEYDKLHANAAKPLNVKGLGTLGKDSQEATAQVRTLEAQVATLTAKLEGVGSAGRQMVSWSTTLGNGFKGSVQVAKAELDKFAPMVKDMYSQAAKAKSEYLRLQESEERSHQLRMRQLQQDRDTGTYLAEVAKYEKRNALIQALDMERYEEAGRAAARLKALQQSRDVEMYESAVKSAEKQLAMERKFILASQEQRLKAAIDARKLMDAGYKGNLSAEFSSQTLNMAQGSNVSALTQQLATLNPAIVKATHSTKLFTDAQINAHSAARGLAGSLGTLWMTYGAIVPLMAGAALGAGFKEAAKAGSEFAYQLTFVKALGGESAEAVEKLSESAKRLAKNGLYGPTEIASGYRILAQAGLDATQALAAMPHVLNLATVG